MTALQKEARHYEILGVIGQGGHGRVYSARMHGAGGFRKDVAIKLLKDEDVAPTLLQRFRDEARILGLVRDRALVSVDPPARLGGRWAIIMEYVEGVSALRVLRAGGPLPPGVALDIVAEVARVLDKVYRAPGPDGRPLRLLHRDIKPGNLQLTRDGDVKLLDFGIARADFDQREAATTADLGGTFGFIAPERLQGADSPAADVYALGVTLRVMVTGERPTALSPDALAALSPDGLAVAALAEEMRADLPEQRPTYKVLEQRLREVRAAVGGPGLREWAETEVEKHAQAGSDDLVGTVLTESFDAERVTGFTGPQARLGATGPPGGRRWVLGMGLAATSGAAALVGGVAAVGLLVVALLAVWQPPRAPDPVGTDLPAPAPVAVAPTPVAPSSPEPADPPAPEAPAPSAEPARPAGPKPPPVPAPSPQAPTLATVDVTASQRSQVYVDGVKIGATPLRGQPMDVGSHTLKLVGPDGATVEATVLVGGRRGATRFDWPGGTTLTAR